MIAYVVTTRFAQTPDGRLWYANGILGYQFWNRYLDVYDSVKLVCQAYPVDRPPDGWHEATGDRVDAAPLSPLHGPGDLMTNGVRVFRTLRSYMRRAGAIHLRGPSVLCDMAWFVMPKGRPYGIEVAGDPYDAFAPGAFTGGLRRVYRHWFSRSLKIECRQATAAAYVTEKALQNRYPSRSGTYSTHYSSIEMNDEAFAEHPKRVTRPPTPMTIVHVGTQNQLYKAPHVLIDAVAIAVSRGIEIKLIMVGDGQFRAQLECQAVNRLGGRAEFTGRVSAGKGVQAVLDRADLFILASFQEGLPKAIIEAMARGLPCIGSNVGGIPELLPAEDLVPAGNAERLAEKIVEVSQDSHRLTAMAERNLMRARAYHIDRIRQRRIAFYQVVRDKSREQGWCQATFTKSAPGNDVGRNAEGRK